MNILIAPDKFKGSLTAYEVCEALKKGLTRNPDIRVREIPLADGGDGTLDAFIRYVNGSRHSVTVRDPLLRLITAEYGLSQDKKTAFVEMANASGLVLLKAEEQNPMKTTTAGTGDLIRNAMESGAEIIYVGIGGSATNDAATGAAHALGIRFLDENNNDLVPTGENLLSLRRIDFTGSHPLLRRIKIVAICDVTNPFYGPDGAAYVYGPQKGATPQQTRALDDGLQQFASLIAQTTGMDLQRIAGSGAGGGFAGGITALLNATLRPGAEVIAELSGLIPALDWADLVITGEGSIDDQTASGKLVAEVCRRGKAERKPVIAVCGRNKLNDPVGKIPGLTDIFSLVDLAPEHIALTEAARLLENEIAKEILLRYGNKKQKAE